jgi:DNA-directed RNA polymerase subunit M/transcription elongation factor TFIIS
MSIVLWEDVWYLECPHCKKIIKIDEQETEAYGVNSFISESQKNIPTKKEIEKHNEKVKKEGGFTIELKTLED